MAHARRGMVDENPGQHGGGTEEEVLNQTAV
jgi:hypothetical protein